MVQEDEFGISLAYDFEEFKCSRVVCKLASLLYRNGDGSDNELNIDPMRVLMRQSQLISNKFKDRGSRTGDLPGVP